LFTSSGVVRVAPVVVILGRSKVKVYFQRSSKYAMATANIYNFLCLCMAACLATVLAKPQGWYDGSNWYYY
ncbi:hypothetical protein OESDEN_06234, partial [Oesophagostomum dentatum]